MENASQALIIAGAILLAILIIAIGMYIYNSAQSNITSSIDSMSTQEKEAHNNQFESYKGKQTGSQISSLITRVIANANTYREESEKVPNVTVTDKITNSGTENFNNAVFNNSGDDNALQDYIDNVTVIKNRVENKHTYYVDFAYGTSGLIDDIIISYEQPWGILL